MSVDPDEQGFDGIEIVVTGRTTSGRLRTWRNAGARNIESAAAAQIARVCCGPPETLPRRLNVFYASFDSEELTQGLGESDAVDAVLFFFRWRVRTLLSVGGVRE